MDAITQFLQEWHLLGVSIGLCTFLIIGLFHPICIKSEYYFGTRCRVWFLVLGLVMCGIAVAVDDVFLSTLAGVTGFSSFWTIKEVTEQRERVKKGWFPMNPRRKDDYK